ncbi:hypothetical protein Tco_1451887 [Tanacetum coccineum]
MKHPWLALMPIVTRIKTTFEELGKIKPHDKSSFSSKRKKRESGEWMDYLGLGRYLYCRLVPSCHVIFDLEPLSLSFDLVFSFEIFKSFSLRSLPSCNLVSWYRHAHTMHHLESLLTISLASLCLDNLEIFKEDLEYQSYGSLCLCLVLSFLDS